MSSVTLHSFNSFTVSEACKNPNAFFQTTGGEVLTYSFYFLKGCTDTRVDNQCYEITQKKFDQTVGMKERRYDAASIVLNGTVLWITGGRNGRFILDTTEFVEFSLDPKAGLPPKLPERLASHTMINLKDNLIMFIGGTSDACSTGSEK